MVKLFSLALLLVHLIGSSYTIRSQETTRNRRSLERGMPPLLSPQTAQITASYDAPKDQTTVRLAPARISGERGKYHSLGFSVFYSYPGTNKRIPDTLSLELLTVVKARKLDPDLYVVFLVDGAEVFLSSNRSAVRNAVPGKRWIGERLVFRIPYETFLNFARARQLSVRMDGLVFDFAEHHLKSLRDFAGAIKE